MKSPRQSEGLSNPLPIKRKNGYDMDMQTINGIPSVTGSRILVHGHSFLGDSLMTTPFLRTLRELEPASVTVIAQAAGKEVYRKQESVDSVISGRSVQRDFYHTALVLKDTFREALRAKKLHIPDRIGFKGEGASLLLTRAVRKTRNHGARRYFELLDLLPPEIPRYTFPVTREDKKEAAALTGKGKLLCIAPCSTNEAKTWPAEFYITLCRQLKKRIPKFTIAVLGAEEEWPVCGEIAEAAGLLDLSGRTTLGGLAAVLQRTTLLISGDTGTMHLASVFPDTGILALFGHTDPVLCGPPNPAAEVIYRPKGVSGITPSEVIAKTLSILGKEK